MYLGAIWCLVKAVIFKFPELISSPRCTCIEYIQQAEGGDSDLEYEQHLML